MTAGRAVTERLVEAGFALTETEHACDNETRANGATNAIRPLTHSSDLSREGIAVNATREVVEQRLLARRQIDGECWRWTGCISRAGYGKACWKGWATRSVHRIAYMIWVGPIPDGLDLDHVTARGCRFRDCFNPAHLEPVDHRTNIARSGHPVAEQMLQTHCLNGHELPAPDPRNGRRRCRICDIARDRARHEREAAASGGKKILRIGGSVWRSGNRWRARVQVDGQRVPAPHSFATEAEADAWVLANRVTTKHYRAAGVQS